MSLSASRYPDWKAPAEDGQMLLWPEPTVILAAARTNHHQLNAANHVLVQGIPLPEVRRRQRAWIGHTDDARPLVATGHQTELYHAGVWVKDALSDRVAKALDGAAYHFAVDTDEPKHLLVRWPGHAEPLTDDPAVAVATWSGQVDAPTPAHLRHIEQAFDAAAAEWSFRPMMHHFFASMRKLSLETPKLPIAVTDAIHHLDWELGLRHHALVVSPIFTSEPFGLFVHHLLADSARFCAAYNDALAEFRLEYKIKSTTRPMPDLKVTLEMREVPFWLDFLDDGTRQRATLLRIGTSWGLRAREGQTFIFDPNAEGWSAAADLSRWMRENQVRLSPRALTLTLFFRLLLVDQFVHGIGGGRYDQVTDDLIERYFGIEAPRFCVTTATLFFPEALGRVRACLPCVEQEGRRLRHGLLGEGKRALVEKIAALPRKSMERGRLFAEMHSMLAAAAQDHPAMAR
ncbi:MAG TPA: hypothetical protein VIL86_10380 [Tepidisphaeraceae bacterium]